jgi:transposase InsO family protein
MRFASIVAWKEEWPVEFLRRIMQVTSRGYRAWRVRPLSADCFAIACRAMNGQNQKWAGDISYIWTSEGWLYLAVILDLYSRRVIGRAVSNRMKRDLVIRALDMAVDVRQPPKGYIHHTDRGSQGGFNRSSQHFLLYPV